MSAPELSSSHDQTVAAVDLGSNSFHMVVGRAVNGQLNIIDRLREPVRLAAGLTPEGALEEAAVERAMACLERFEQRLREIPLHNLRVVGTNTLRRARSAGDFMSRVRHVFHVPIEVLPGQEEARLIYLGVARGLADDAGRRLVVDIGGGSTECVLGERSEARVMDSLQMGCVSYSRRFFGDGAITSDNFKRAETAARLELRPIQSAYRTSGFKECVGSSGTIKAAREILTSNGWSEAGVTLEGMRKLKRSLISAGHASNLEVTGLQADRAPVIAGGVAILKAVLQSFKIPRMNVSDMALREGLLYDLLGRIDHEDVRDDTIQAMSLQHHVDLDQARRVERTSLVLFDQVAEDWRIAEEEVRQALAWGARLHEVGLATNHSGYHRHGADLVTHSRMAGFSREDKRLLAALVLCHRRRLDRELFESLPPFHRDPGLKICVLLRIAARIERGRSRTAPPEVEAEARGDRGLHLTFPSGWLKDHALTRADLANEASRLALAGIDLSYA